MGSQVFYRKYRSQTFAELVGQEHITRTLLNALKSGHISHAYLFCGPRGTGKTSTGRLLAKAVNCLNNGKGEPCNTCRMCTAITEGHALDVIEIDAASNTGVDSIRELREKVNYAPNEARYKVYIIDEVHMLSTNASNALLKTLEEPPSHAIFILATTETHKILPTIMSRCQRFDFHRISQNDIVKQLTHICNSENIQVPEEGLKLIAKAATGSLRDAENLLEQITTFYGNHIELSQIKATLGITGDWRAKELVKQILNNDVAAAIRTIHNVNDDGLDLSQFTRDTLEYLRNLLLVRTGVTEIEGITPEDLAELKGLSANTSIPQIIKAIKYFNQVGIHTDYYTTLQLELAIVDSCTAVENLQFSQPVKSTPQETPVIEKPQASSIKETKITATSAKPSKEPPVSSSGMQLKHEPDRVSSRDPLNKAEFEASKGKTEILFDLENIKQHWKQILDSAPPEIKRTNAIALLRGGKPVSFEENCITIAFRYPIHKENMEKADNKRNVEKLFSEYLGRPCKVNCIHVPEDNPLVEAAKKLGAQVTSVEDIP